MKREICIVKHVEDEGPGRLGEYFQALELEILTVELTAVMPSRRPSGPAAALVILGGPMNVYEEEAYPFSEVRRSGL